MANPNFTNCYDCIHRRNVPGDSHSACGYPLVEQHNLFFLGNGMIGKFPSHFQIEEYGWSQGWFAWPVNFDPIWLKNCDWFEKPPSENKQTENKPETPDNKLES